MKKISTNSLSLQWKLDALLSLTEMEHKTHNPLLKPFTFCTIFAWFGIYKGFPDWVITPLLTLFACWPVSSVKYCKCYLILNDSPRSSSCQISFNALTSRQFGTLTQYCILLWRGTCIGDPDDLAWPSDVEPVCAWMLCRSFSVP